MKNKILLIGLILLIAVPIIVGAKESVDLVVTGSIVEFEWGVIDGAIDIQLQAPGYNHSFQAQGEEMTGLMSADCGSLTERVKMQNGMLYAVTDASGTVVKIGFKVSYGELLQQINTNAGCDGQVWVKIRGIGEDVWVKVINGKIVRPSPPSKKRRPKPNFLKIAKECQARIMQLHYGFPSKLIKLIQKEFSILTVDRAMRDALDDPNEFLVALWGYSLHNLQIRRWEQSDILIFQFRIGNNFTRKFMPKDASMKVNPCLSVAKVTKEGQMVIFPEPGKLWLVPQCEDKLFTFTWNIKDLEPGEYVLYLGNFYQDWPCFHMTKSEIESNGHFRLHIDTFPVPVNH